MLPWPASTVISSAVGHCRTNARQVACAARCINSKPGVPAVPLVPGGKTPRGIPKPGVVYLLSEDAALRRERRLPSASRAHVQNIMNLQMASDTPFTIDGEGGAVTTASGERLTAEFVECGTRRQRQRALGPHLGVVVEAVGELDRLRARQAATRAAIAQSRENADNAARALALLLGRDGPDPAWRAYRQSLDASEDKAE